MSGTTRVIYKKSGATPHPPCPLFPAREPEVERRWAAVRARAWRLLEGAPPEAPPGPVTPSDPLFAPARLFTLGVLELWERAKERLVALGAREPGVGALDRRAVGMWSGLCKAASASGAEALLFAQSAHQCLIGALDGLCRAMERLDGLDAAIQRLLRLGLESARRMETRWPRAV